MKPEIKLGDPLRQDASWYVNQSGMELVWEQPDLTPYCVNRIGEMRVHYSSPTGDTTLRYTSDLEGVAGIKTDKDLERIVKEPDVFDWVNNAWFEVLSDSDPYCDFGVFDDLDSAILYAVELANGSMPEPDIIY